MRSLIKLLVLLAVFVASGSLVIAQSTTSPADTGASGSAAATKAEVDQLRSEVAAQRQTIEELKALVEKLAQAQEIAKSQTGGAAAQIKRVADAPVVIGWQPADSASISVHLSDAVLHEPEPTPEMVAEQAAQTAPKKEPPLTAGWSGEHFYIRSADGQFGISPYGYLDND